MNSLIGIVGDYNATIGRTLRPHRALEELGFGFEWVGTTDVNGNPEQRLAAYDGYAELVPKVD